MRVSTICAAVFATGITCALAQANCLPAQFQATLPAPPQDDWADAQRLQLMVELRTPERIAAIEQEADDLTFKFWHSAGLQSRAHPQLERQITAVQKIAEKIVLSLKAQYARTRPSFADTSLSTVVPVPWHSSYPSGHATQSMLTALVLGSAVPSAKDDLKALAVQIAHGREIAGLHYASDTQAGFALAYQIWTALDARCKPEPLAQYHAIGKDFPTQVAQTTASNR